LKGFKGGLVAFIPAGYPSLEGFLQLVRGLREWGADALELGVPTLNAKYDGPTVRAAYRRVLEGGVDVYDALARVEDRFILLSYYELALEAGLERFMEGASKVGAFTVLFPDLLIDYLEELGAYVELCRSYELRPSFFITSCFPHRLISSLTKYEPSFVYMGLMACTGVLLPISARRNISVVRGLLDDVPLIVGFAISAPEQVAECIKAGADGVVVGSALIRALDEGGLEGVKSLMRRLRGAIEVGRGA